MSELGIPFVSEAYDRLMADRLRNMPAVPTVRVTGYDIAQPVTDIRAARDRLNLTQAALAEKLGIDAPRLSKIENGATIPPYLDLAMRTLLSLEPPK
jgi:DNA-binding XRE family transcriptional regulator